ncbi:putative lipoprotein YbaY [Novosphingobium hassiacum]|uniref:Putative lipoprotein YbaY n=1 Tax=Novosphingobium hassiacum TaxID=173676 RepID=A0A7W6EXF2_9SPHN|nr:putative lipoprotein YbaY [Novosphingobium hassiacum]
MKRYLCLIRAMLAAAATPALASEASPSAPTPQRTADHQVMSEQVQQGLAQLRETLEPRARSQARGDHLPPDRAAHHNRSISHGTACVMTLILRTIWRANRIAFPSGSVVIVKLGGIGRAIRKPG